MASAPSNTILYDKIRAVEWENGRLKLIDQRMLPGKFEHLYLDHLPESAKAITDMVVRGAPAIGVTAAYAVVLAARDRYKENPDGWQKAIQADLNLLAEARPTAVNLRWAVEHMRGVINAGIPGDPVPAAAGGGATHPRRGHRRQPAHGRAGRGADRAGQRRADALQHRCAGHRRLRHGARGGARRLCRRADQEACLPTRPAPGCRARA